jgi:hypothetical protein
LRIIEQAPLLKKIGALRFPVFFRGSSQPLFVFDSLLREAPILLQGFILLF